jgi:hypothetical protein
MLHEIQRFWQVSVLQNTTAHAAVQQPEKCGASGRRKGCCKIPPHDSLKKTIKQQGMA